MITYVTQGMLLVLAIGGFSWDPRRWQQIANNALCVFALTLAWCMQ